MNFRKTEHPAQRYSGLDFLNDQFYSDNRYWRITPIEGGFGCFLNESIYLTEKDRRMDSIYLEMASTWSRNSSCKRAQVGCLIVKNKSIISDGYNGSPTGFPNNCEDSENNTLSWVLHAEANAITKLSKSTLSSDGSTLYVTMSPCFECSKLIIQSGIKKVVFTELYRKRESIPFLLMGGIEIVRF